MSPQTNRLTPPSSIEALEKRFELGRQTKGTEAWNASTSQEKLDDVEWIRDRIRHGRKHLAHYMDILNASIEDDGDDDGAAIMWLGCMLCEAYTRRKAQALK